MRRVLALGVIACAVLFVVPAIAAPPGPTGFKLSIIGVNPQPVFIEENTAFHVIHGWICNATPLNVYNYPTGHELAYLNGTPIPGDQQKCLRSDFRLWVDGKRTSDYVISEWYVDGKTRVLAARRNLTNFPDGLVAGTYQFSWEFWFDGVLSTSPVGTGTRTVVVCPTTTQQVPLGGPCPSS